MLRRLSTSAEVSQSQLVKGVRRVADHVADLCLDSPSAKGQFEEVVKVGREGREGWGYACVEVSLSREGADQVP